MILHIPGVKQRIVEKGNIALQFLRYVSYDLSSEPLSPSMIKHNGNHRCEFLFVASLVLPYIEHVAKELQMNVSHGITLMFIKDGNLDLRIPIKYITGNVPEIRGQLPIYVFSGIVRQCPGMQFADNLPGQGSLNQVLEVFFYREGSLEKTVVNIA
jgi:hypothetical protein